MTRAACLLCLLVAQATWAAPIEGYKVSYRINVDGHLDERCWHAAPQITEFLSTARDNPPAEVASKAWIAYDDRKLYVAVRCEEPRMDKLLVTPRERDGSVYQDDCIEIFLQAKQDVYYWFAFNTGHGEAEGRFLAALGAATKDARAWDAHWCARVAKWPWGWTAEAAIRWDCLDLSPPLLAPWKINVGRERWGGGTEYSSSSGAFHDSAVWRELQPSDIDLSRYDLKVEVTDWGMMGQGENLLTVELHASSDFEGYIDAYAWYPEASWLPPVAPRPVKLAAGQTVRIKRKYETFLFRSGLYSLEVTASHSPHEEPFASRLRYFTAPDLLRMAADRPIFYVSDPPPVALLQLGLGDLSLLRCKVHVTLVNEATGEVVGTGSTARLREQDVRLPLDCNRLPPGRYRLSATLSVPGLKRPATTSAPIRIIKGPFE